MSPICCDRHKTSGMIEMENKLPKCGNCNKLALFAAKINSTPCLNEKSPEPSKCKNHKVDNMISISADNYPCHSSNCYLISDAIRLSEL